MAYRVGEAAEILGISAQGVRFFERKNYLKSSRQENGYRAFERGDITIAQQIQDYASVGFTLQEAAQMVLASDLDTIEEQLQLCDARIEDKIAQLQYRRQAVALRQQVVARVKQNRPAELREEEEWLYLPLEGEGCLKDTSEKRRIEKEWMSYYPYTMLAKLPIWADGRESDSRGVCVSGKAAEELGLSRPEGIIYLPAGLYWNVVICKPIGETRGFSAIYQTAVENGFRPIGPMVSIVEISTVVSEVRSTISQVRLPVKQKEI